MSCKHCTDPDGAACFPVYGLGPHKHAGESFMGSTVMLDQNGVDGFTPNPDEPGMGVWWCTYCGDGKPEERKS